jgi:hypothetical protein
MCVWGQCRRMRADEPTQMAAHFFSRRRLAGTQQYRYRPRHRRVIDMDRQKTALVIMGIEERQLLVAVNDINRVVDVERHRCRRGRIAGAIEIDHHTHQPDQVAQRGRVLPARDGRLRAQIGPAVGQPSTRQLERRIGAQPVKVVAVLITAGNGENAGAQDIGQEMGDPLPIAPVRNHLGEPLGDTEPTLRLGEQHDAAIRSDPSAIKGSGDLLALNSWKAERQQIIVGHWRAWRAVIPVKGLAQHQILHQIKSLRHLRRPKSAPVMNKTG